MTEDQSIIHLAHLIRSGEITQPSPRHDNPEDYGLTRKDAINARVRYLRSILAINEGLLLKWQRLYATNPEWYSEEKFYEYTKIVDKIQKELKYTRGRLKVQEDKKEQYDIHQIKAIPIGSLFPTNAAGFFINNPLRPEHSPSNSLHWNKNKNKWCDYASGEYGDIIDLVMKINKCTIKEALKILSCG